MLIKLYLDIRNRRFVQSATNGGAFILPAFIRQDSYSLQIQLLEPNPTGGLASPFSVVDVTDLDIRVGIGTGDPNTLLAYDATWTKDVDNDLFTGTFNLNTTEMEAALDAAGAAGLSKTFEVDVIEDGTIHTAIQTACTIKPDVIRDGVVPPEDYEPPSALLTNLALILEDSATVDVVFSGDKVHFDATTADTMLRYWTESTELVSATPASKWTPNQEGLDPVPAQAVPDVTGSVEIVYGTYPAGTYRVNYIGGAFRYGPGLTQFKINASGAFGFRIVHSGGTEVEGPGNYTGYASVAACEAGNAGAYVEFTHTGGTIGVYLLDSPYDDNTAGTPSPTFELVGANANVHALIQSRGTGSVILADGLSAAPVPTATSQLATRFPGGYKFDGGAATFESTAAGDDPVAAQDFVTKTWGEANLGGGGVTKWLETDGTFGGKEFSRFTPIDAGADADAIISPKGTGALLANEPDGISAGGNIRGTQSVDLQMQRGDATQVASGITSVIAGGMENTASGLSSVVSGGDGNSATGIRSTVSGGQTGSATGDGSSIIGGQGNTASGQYSSVLGGLNNTASGVNASAVAGSSQTAGGTNSAVLFGSGSSTGADNAVSGGDVAVANHTGSLVFSSAGSGGASSTAVDQATLNYVGGYRMLGGPASFHTSAATGSKSMASGDDADASGQNSVCLGGIAGTASAFGSACIGGNTNSATIDNAATLGGVGIVASGSASVAVGGATNTASGASSACVGGEGNAASAKNSLAHGGQAVADVSGQIAQGCPEFGNGKAQASSFVLKAVSTNAADTEMLTDQETRLLMRYGASNAVAWAFEALIVASRNDAVGEYDGFKLSGVIAINGGGVGTCALVGTVIKTSLTGGATVWDCNASADTTYGALKFTVNGQVSKTIRWHAAVKTSEIGTG